MGRGNTCRFILKRACTIEALSSADRALCVVGRLEWKKKRKGPGHDGKRKERREALFPLPIVPSPLPPARIQFFVYICYFYWDTQWESLRRPDFLDTWSQRKQKLWEWIRLENCGNIPEKARSRKSCEHSGNPSGQNGISRVSSAKKLSLSSCDKSFIDQACSVKMAE